MNFSTFFNTLFKIPYKPKQFLLVMKLTTILLLTALCQVSASVYSQNITIKQKNVSMDAIFKSIEKQSEYVFLYDNLELSKAQKISIDVKNASIGRVLDLCFKDQPLSYKIFDKTIVLKKKDAISQPMAFDLIRGKILDEKRLADCWRKYYGKRDKNRRYNRCKRCIFDKRTDRFNIGSIVYWLYTPRNCCWRWQRLHHQFTAGHKQFNRCGSNRIGY